MQILTNKNNLEVLHKMISNAKHEIKISSGWIRSHILKKVIN